MTTSHFDLYNQIIIDMSNYVYLRTHEINIYKIGRSGQKNPKKRSEINKAKTICLLTTYNELECEKYIIKQFNENFELVKGREFFKGEFNSIRSLFQQSVLEFNTKYYNNNIKKIYDDTEIQHGDNENYENYEDNGDNGDDRVCDNNLNNKKSNKKSNKKIKKFKGFFICDKCNKTFTNKRNRDAHINKEICSKKKLTVLINGKTKYLCEFCDKVYSRNYYVQCHIKRDHSNLFTEINKLNKKITMLEKKLSNTTSSLNININN